MVWQAENSLNEFLSCSFAVVATVANLNPAAAETQPFRSRLRQYARDGGVLDPYIGLRAIGGDDDGQWRVLQKGASVRLRGRELDQKLRIVHHDEFPGFAVARRWRAKERFDQ